MVFLVFLDYENNSDNNSLVQTVRDLEFQQYAFDSTFFIVYYDSELRIKYANQLYCDRLGYTLGEILFKSYRFNDAGYHSEEYHQELIETCKSGKVWSGLVKIFTSEGEYLWLSRTIVPVPKNSDISYSFL